MSEAIAARVLRALLFLGFLDDALGPTPQLIRMAKSVDPAEYRSSLGGVLRAAYSDVLSSPGEFEDASNAFLDYDPPSQRHRMAALFLGLCKEAGISPHHRQVAGQLYFPLLAAPPQDTIRRGKARARFQDQTPAAESPVLWGLFRRLPQPGGKFGKRERTLWLEAVKSVLDLEFGPDDEDATRAG
jgi:hypothetical protein